MLLLQTSVLAVLQALVQFAWKSWKVRLSQRIELPPAAGRTPCIFLKRFLLLDFWEERRWVGSVSFHMIERRGSCLNFHMAIAVSTSEEKTAAPTPPFAQPKVVTEPFVTHLFAWHHPASLWHFLQPVTFMMPLFITIMWCSVPGGVVTLQLQVSEICSSSLMTGQPGFSSGFESQKPFYLGHNMRHGSPQLVLRYKHLAKEGTTSTLLSFRGLDLIFFGKSTMVRYSKSFTWGFWSREGPWGCCMAESPWRLCQAAGWWPLRTCRILLSSCRWEVSRYRCGDEQMSSTGSFGGNCCLREPLVPCICLGSCVIRKE